MILDSIQNSEKYYGLHPYFKQAFEYLKQLSLNDFNAEEEKIEIIGKELFAINAIVLGKNNLLPESHKKYIDIQYVKKGKDEMRWIPLSLCENPIGKFNLEKDIIFYSDWADQLIQVPENYFVIFFPTDAHAPLAGESEMYKSVIKVCENLINTNKIGS